MSAQGKTYPSWWFDCELALVDELVARKYRIVNEPWPPGCGEASERVLVDSTVGRPVERFGPSQLLGVRLWEGVDEYDRKRRERRAEENEAALRGDQP